MKLKNILESAGFKILRYKYKVVLAQTARSNRIRTAIIKVDDTLVVIKQHNSGWLFLQSKNLLVTNKVAKKIHNIYPESNITWPEHPTPVVIDL